MRQPRHATAEPLLGNALPFSSTVLEKTTLPLFIAGARTVVGEMMSRLRVIASDALKTV
jgi:hypothetical protein